MFICPDYDFWTLLAYAAVGHTMILFVVTIVWARKALRK